jgi:hypothetical protein
MTAGSGRNEPALYSWDVEGSGDGRRVSQCGVTDDRQAALRHVHHALADAPDGTRGVVRRVELSVSGRPVYVHLDTIAWARRDGGGP